PKEKTVKMNSINIRDIHMKSTGRNSNRSKLRSVPQSRRRRNSVQDYSPQSRRRRNAVQDYYPQSRRRRNTVQDYYPQSRRRRNAVQDYYPQSRRRRNSVQDYYVDVVAMIDYKRYSKFLAQANYNNFTAMQNILEYYAFVFSG
ncbi:hypothetical protein BgiMline_031900, partial [Biomphalaria glabrata]